MLNLLAHFIHSNQVEGNSILNIALDDGWKMDQLKHCVNNTSNRGKRFDRQKKVCNQKINYTKYFEFIQDIFCSLCFKKNLDVNKIVSDTTVKFLMKYLFLSNYYLDTLYHDLCLKFNVIKICEVYDSKIQLMTFRK